MQAMAFGIHLVCHYLADYYMQTAKIAAKKTQSYYYTFIHSVLYALPFLAMLGAFCFPPPLVWMSALAVLSHFAVDMAKCFAIKSLGAKIARGAYLVDQLLHIGSLLALALLFGRKLTGLWLFDSLEVYLPYLLVAVYAVMALQPAYVSFKMLLSQRCDIAPQGQKDNLCYQLASLLVAALILLRQWIVLGLLFLAGIAILLSKKMDRKIENLWALAFVYGYNLIVAVAIFCGIARV